MRRLLPFLRVPISGLVLMLCVGVSCTHDSGPKVPLQLNLYSGIAKVARLGDPLSHVLQNPLWKPSRETLSATSDLGKLGFTDVLRFEEVGVSVYFRHDQAAMIQVQEPFAGTIEGKATQAFSGQPAAGKTWEETLTRDYGFPTARGSGGRLGAQALFYGWGDVSYNKLGPNQYTLYQSAEIGSFRQKNFGQEISLFKND